MTNRAKVHKKGRKLAIGAALLLAAVCLGFLILGFFKFQNNALQTSYYTVDLARDIKILHLSDLHSKSFKGRLAERVRAEAPDLIFLTGDIFNTGEGESLEGHDILLTAISETAPAYYVTGNHEIRKSYTVHDKTTEYTFFDKAPLKELLDSYGIIWLNNEAVTVTVNGNEYNIIGLSDVLEICPVQRNNYFYEDTASAMEKVLAPLVKDGATNILLSHRPEYFDVYSSFDIDLVFCGHAHGGQFRIFGQGLYAPGQGVLPKLTEGVHTKNGTSIIISRGLGPSRFPFRLFNRPEIVCVTSGDNQ